MRDRTDVEWMLVNVRVMRSWHGEWRWWIQGGQHEHVPTPGSTSTTEIQNAPPLDEGEET